MDKINEEQKNVFESRIDESASEVDGEYILAKVVGEGFTPDGLSRNGRFYPRKLWERVCKDPELQERMKNKRIYGTIGHALSIDDESFRKGEFSHIITKMYINESGKGIIEALVVGTPAGRVLNTFLRAGSKLFVSTRASGDILPNQLHEGYPIVDPDSYQLEGVDFVLEPGFLNASPNLVESLLKENTPEDLKKLEEAIKSQSEKIPEKESVKSTLLTETLEDSGKNKTTSIQNKESIMETKEKDEITMLNESLTRKNAELKKSIDEAVRTNSDLVAENKSLKEQVNLLNEEANESRIAYKKLAIYEALGSAEEIQAVFDKIPDLKSEIESAREQISDYESELGSAEEIRSALEKAEEIADELDVIYSELGSAEEIRSALEAAEDYMSSKEEEEEELGSAEEIREALYNAKKVITEYRKIGTPRELKRCLKVLSESIKTTENNQKKATAVKIAEKYNIPERTAYNLIRRGISEREIVEMVGTFPSSGKKISLVDRTAHGSAVESLFDKSKRGLTLMEHFAR